MNQYRREALTRIRDGQPNGDDEKLVTSESRLLQIRACLLLLIVIIAAAASYLGWGQISAFGQGCLVGGGSLAFLALWDRLRQLAVILCSPRAWAADLLEETWLDGDKR